MKAAVLTAIREMEIRDIPDPVLECDADVLIRVAVVGVCGSDVHYYATGRIGSQVVHYPYRVGHEFSGTVVATGRAVTSLSPGDRVAVDPAMPCGSCDQCRGGREHTCRDLRFLGCPGQADGCLCETIVMPAKSCHAIPDSMTFEQAAISEPLSIGVYAVRQSVPMRGAAIGILGCGPIGLSVMLSAIAGGVESVFATDRIDDRLAVAAAAGASWTGNPNRQDIVAAIAAERPLLLDCVFECCGEQEALDQAVALLKPGGKLMLIGIPRCDRVSFAVDHCRHKEICIQNVRRQNDCVQATLNLISNDEVQVDFMTTHRFDLARTQEAFELVDAYRDGVVKAMIHMG
jgi:L-iditol 2-dehydrogenase